VITIAAGQVAPAAGGGGQAQVLVTGEDTPVAGYDVVMADPGERVADRFGLAGGGRIVVRPDGYVGAVTTLDDATPIADYFATIAR
jgi:F420-dependent methylenetetrahydromethanopterin dehydrogenase